MENIFRRQNVVGLLCICLITLITRRCYGEFFHLFNSRALILTFFPVVYLLLLLNYRLTLQSIVKKSLNLFCTLSTMLHE